VARLDRDRIAAIALAIVDKRGLAGFTIRAVAESLGVTPMALYHHVRDKAELASLIVSATVRKHPLATTTGNWREDLWALARWTREVSLAHPAGQEIRRTYRVYNPEILQMAERWLSLWQQSGLPLEKAVVAATTTSMAIGGLVSGEAVLRDLDQPDPTMTARLPNARLLLQSKYDPETMFELAVRSIIDGLHTRLMSEPTLKRHAAKPRSKSRAK
jgi:AcrR family transcriptional regulator